MQKNPIYNFLKAKSHTRTKLKVCGGFTLLESMIAIAVFSVGVSTAIMVITSAINTGTRTKNKIVAANLAQEGVEVIRNVRDRNWMAGNAWTDAIANVSGCIAWDTDNSGGALTPFAAAPCAPAPNMAFDGSHYVMDTAASMFTRTVTTVLENPGSIDPNNPERLNVTALATCGAGCSITVSEYLYDWK
ncbi:MAG: type II secretion system protein [Patescibacteria group bacterium]